MSFRLSRRLLADPPYKSSVLSSIMKEHALSKQNAGEFDHIIIDCGPAAGASLRFTKDLYGPERDYETAQAVFKTHIQHVAKLLRPRKSVFVVLDGSDPMWKVRKMRSSQQKKHWNRFLRSGATPLGFSVEERSKFLASSDAPWLQELVLSGPSTPGPVECKISQWMLDLAARANENAEAYEEFVAKNPISKPDAAGSSTSTSSSSNPPAYAGQQQLAQQSQKKMANASTHAAMFPGVTRGDSIAFIGQADNFPQVLAMTPFLNVAMVHSDGKEGLRAQFVRQILEWHGFTELWEEPDNTIIARARTDLVLMRLLHGGLSAMSLQACPGLKIEDMLDVYHQFLWPAKKYLTKDHPTSGALLIDTANLEQLLTRVANIKQSNIRVEDKIAADYLEILCQSMCALCDGGIKNYGFIPKTNFDVPPPQMPGQPAPNHIGLQLQQLVYHLRALAGRPLAASVDRDFAMTPAEMLLTSALEPQWISEILPAYTNGHPLPAGVAEDIVNNKNLRDVYSKAKSILSLVINNKKQQQQQQQQQQQKSTIGTPVKTKDMLHRALYHCPTHVWTRRLGTRGPPEGFVYRSVNLGEAAAERKTRHAVMTSSSFGPGAESLLEKQIANPIVYYTADGKWVEALEEGLPKHLYVGAPASALASIKSAASSDQQLQPPPPQFTLLNRTENPGKFTVVNWNVQFSKYSGKTTPLGKPGIDWCSATRYKALEKVLAETDADIISMQECEEPWWQELSRSSWVRNSYVFSCPSRGKSINKWGSMLLIHRRVPLLRQGLLSMSAGSGHVSWMPTATIQLSETKTLAYATCHLLAPFQQSNIEMRAHQITTLMKNVGPKTMGGEEVVVAGDFNDYPTNFFVMPDRMNFRDAWVDVHGSSDGDAGWTINGRKNSFTAQIIEEEFYGRADRVLVKSQHLKAKEACLIGTESVKSMLKVDSIKDYLFPSDHFGVKITFDVTG